MGSRDQLRKEGYKQREIQKAAGRLQTSLIDVDGVTHRLERIERDADRQQHRQHEPRRLETRRRQQRRQILGEELKYLKNPKTPRLPATLSHSQSFRSEFLFEPWITRPQVKSSSVEKTIRPRNRQSQKP